jgi:uncharacterized repeat protein (TIGR03803 family)
MYGNTEYGGELAQGTVFEIRSDGGAEQVLYSFTGHADGFDPGALVFYNQSLYGTTFYGGLTNCQDGRGCGVVFKVSP